MYIITFRNRPVTLEKLWGILSLHPAHLKNFKASELDLYICGKGKYETLDAYRSLTGEEWGSHPRHLRIQRMAFR